MIRRQAITDANGAALDVLVQDLTPIEVNAVKIGGQAIVARLGKANMVEASKVFVSNLIANAGLPWYARPFRSTIKREAIEMAEQAVLENLEWLER